MWSLGTNSTDGWQIVIDVEFYTWARLDHAWILSFGPLIPLSPNLDTSEWEFEYTARVICQSVVKEWV